MNYLVHVNILAGGYEKGTYALITGADGREQAGKAAMILECHNDPVFMEDGYRVEDGFDFIYSVFDMQKVDDEGVKFLESVGISAFDIENIRMPI